MGLLIQPGSNYDPAVAKVWAADNGCFGKNYVGDDAYLVWLAGNAAHASRCLFAPAPDVVGDAAATLARSQPMLGQIRGLGYPAAFVAQDGLEDLTMPWDDFDVLFIGGSTDWKLSLAAAGLCREAKSRGKQVHVGRVNSGRRWAYLAGLGVVDTVDGTYLAFGCDTNLPAALSWPTLNAQGVLI